MLAVDGDEVTVGILNPDGSHAEMSGNGTRIAAAWLMTRTNADVAQVRVGEREVEVRRVADGEALNPARWAPSKCRRLRSSSASS